LETKGITKYYHGLEICYTTGEWERLQAIKQARDDCAEVERKSEEEKMRELFLRITEVECT
jgi:hypothetical protein